MLFRAQPEGEDFLLTNSMPREGQAIIAPIVVPSCELLKFPESLNVSYKQHLNIRLFRLYDTI